MAISFPENLTRDQVKTMFLNSEGQPTPRGAGNANRSLGHSGSRHVDITNEGMKDRLVMTREQRLAQIQRQQENRRRRGSGAGAPIEIVTSFIRFDDQIDAAFALLNHPIADQGRDYFAEHRGDRRIAIEAPIPTVKVRCASNGRTWTQPLSAANIVLDRGANGKLHIVTCYAILELTRGVARCVRN